MPLFCRRKIDLKGNCLIEINNMKQKNMLEALIKIQEMPPVFGGEKCLDKCVVKKERTLKEMGILKLGKPNEKFKKRISLVFSSPSCVQDI